MFDIGWSELLVIGALALIVVGPKDLPVMLRTLGRYVGKARGMAREFQRTLEDAAREADLPELRDVQRQVSGLSRDIGSSARAYADRLGEDRKPAKPAPGSLDAADEAENAAWQAEQAARKARAEKLAQIEADAAALEAEARGETPPAPAPDAAPRAPADNPSGARPAVPPAAPDA
ncbi:Sec-independent protein translocase protein TatB [Oceanicella actignis]|uniref:Sec-independent protein translocase protein TatB n=1 Tax=Oceanicella actignis TaxID=1189325 RepID=UPI0011E66730|nr:Sec-independent protein translocase protein TatB [Oceanicella actignis]TYO89956.1 sec-independent protein translocase protein TatB [Oceanicella actignis]